jgi:hypothetical protein
MMQLDCNTPKGKKAIGYQYMTQSILESYGFFCVNMSTQHHNSDVILSKRVDGKLVVYGLAEIKTRYKAGDKILTVDYLKSSPGYLVTLDKITSGVALASQLNVPFYLIVMLIGDMAKILVWKIWDKDYLFEFESKRSSTRKTVNGGIANRLNAYLPIDKAIILE